MKVTRLSTTPLLLLLTLLLWVSPSTPARSPARRQKPHLVVVMADDLGWSDVGYRDPEMATPIIDTLAREGVVLDSAYMQQVCTPSRSAFLSGIYPFRVGLQNSVLTALTNKSMPIDLRLLPEDLQAVGYSTHYVGKWHLGFCNPRMTPTYRGFQSFYGMYNGHGDYYTHRSKWNGFDLQNNTGRAEDTVFSQDWAADGVYSTDLFTDAALDIVTSHPADRPLFLMLSYQAVHGPLQVPEHYVTKYCSHVTSGGKDRKLHCAMTAAMDEGIGRVMAALEARGMADNLITLFTSDNGGPVKQGSSNWPLRGSKITLWEGGTRSVTILHSKKHLPRAPYTWSGLMHAVDWYPTLLRAVGARKRTPKGLDGIDNWRRIVRGKSSRRREFVYNIDDVKNTAALRYKKYKLVNNKPGSPDGWYHPPAGVVNNFTRNYRKYPEYMLYDLNKDPSETTDIIGEKRVRRVVAKMKAKLRKFKSQMVPTVSAKKVNGGKPRFHGGAWASGWC